MLLPMLEVGYGNYILADQVLMLLNPSSKPSKRIILNAKANNKFIDMTKSRAGKCLILFKNSEVAMSAFDISTIKNRYMKYVNKINKESSRISLEPFLELGYKNYILPYNVLGIYSVDNAAISKIVKNAKNNGMAIDCKQGHELRSAILLDSGHVVLSAKSAETIMKKYMNYVDSVNKGDLEDTEDILDESFQEV